MQHLNTAYITVESFIYDNDIYFETLVVPLIKTKINSEKS